jgi:uncharacterized RDD family membrane protein YckC
MTLSMPSMPVAGLPRRLAALIYDSLLLLALWFATAALLLAASGGLLSQPDRPPWLLLLERVSLLLVTFLFWGGFWTHGGQTLGMRAWRLKLVRDEGGPISWHQAVQRCLAAVLSLAPLGLGYLWVLIDPHRRAWHDRLSGTRVVVLPKNREKYSLPPQRHGDAEKGIR